MAYKEEFMTRALELAQIAGRLGEIPVGVVIVQHGKIVGEGYNLREHDKNPLAHAEIIAIRQAAETLGGWRLVDCEMYVTLEPCTMCAGAIVQSRIVHLYMGAPDPKAGAVISRMKLLDESWLNHHVVHEVGYMAEASANLLKQFFKDLRQRKQKR